MFLQEWVVSKENGEVCSIVMQQNSLHQLWAVSKLNFLTLILLSTIYPILFADANLDHKSPNFGTPVM